MSSKVVQGDIIFFRDDVEIIDSELVRRLVLPADIPVFDRDEVQIFYKGHIFVATEKPTKDTKLQVFSETLGLKETKPASTQEQGYFKRNAEEIEKLKVSFIERSVNGVDILNDEVAGSINQQISIELTDRIESEYKEILRGRGSKESFGGGVISRKKDKSVFVRDMKGVDRAMLLDGKVYRLSTMPEYISKFKPSLDRAFFHELMPYAETATPEDVYKKITSNAGKVHRKVLPLVRNKIWHNEDSFELYLDGTYWIPEYVGKDTEMLDNYKRLLERQVKYEAANEGVGGR